MFNMIDKSSVCHQNNYLEMISSRPKNKTKETQTFIFQTS